MKKISAVITTRGNSSPLQRALDSLQGFEELVIVDRSGDPEVREIAERNGVRLVYLDTTTEATEKGVRNAIVQSLRHEWVFFINSDEVVSPTLKEFIREYAESNPPYSALYIPRKNFLMHKFLRSTYPDYRPRLFRKDRVLIPPRVDQFVVVDGPTQTIAAADSHLALLHYGSSFRAATKAMNLATDVEADKNESLNPNFLSLVFQPFGAFLKSYFVTGFWRFGAVGFIRSCMDSYHRFLLLAKIYEIRHRDQTRECINHTLAHPESDPA